MTLVDYGGVQGFAEGSALQAPEYPFTMGLAVLCERGSVEFTFRAGGVQVDSRDAGGTQPAGVREGPAAAAVGVPGR